MFVMLNIYAMCGFICMFMIKLFHISCFFLKKIIFSFYDLINLFDLNLPLPPPPNTQKKKKDQCTKTKLIL